MFFANKELDISFSENLEFNYENLIGRRIIFLNPYSVVNLYKDRLFAKTIEDNCIAYIDGIFLKLLMSATKGKSKRVTGLTYTLDFLRFHNDRKSTREITFVGGKPGSGELLLKKITKNYANLKIKYLPMPIWDSSLKGVVDFIKEQLRDEGIIFISATAPKQEKIAKLIHESNKNCLIVCVGAVFDYLSGQVTPPPRWISLIGLEWLYRLFKEPKRMFKRLFPSLVLFPLYFLANLKRFKIIKEIN